jgi:hypothetical protein
LLGLPDQALDVERQPGPGLDRLIDLFDGRRAGLDRL